MESASLHSVLDTRSIVSQGSLHGVECKTSAAGPVFDTNKWLGSSKVHLNFLTLFHMNPSYLLHCIHHAD